MLRRTLMILGCSFFVFSNMAHAEYVVWAGQVNSNGTPTSPIPLQLHKRYQIKVSGVVNLGKWKQGGKALANDACFEYVAGEETADNPHMTKLVSLKNSNDIKVCNGEFHKDHVYESLPFTAEQTKIHFWVYDTNYEDNYGSFQVEISEVSDAEVKNN